MRVQIVEGREPWHRHQEVPAAIADQAFHFAFIVALAGAAEPVLEQVMGSSFAEYTRPLVLAVAKDTSHRDPGVVIKDRARHAAEEGKSRDMTVAEGFRCLAGISLYKAGGRVRKAHRQEVELALHPADDRQRLAKIDLSMAGRVRQRT